MKKIVQKIKQVLFSKPRIKSFCIKVYNFWCNNSKFDKSNIASTAVLKNFKVKDNGKGNRIIISEDSRLNNCSLKNYGNNNTVIIGKGCTLNNLNIWFEDDNNIITIGDKTTIHGETNLACIEGTCIDIGEDCMFSSCIEFRTGDSHSVVDLHGKRVNKSKNIHIGNHVWVGQNVFVGKGSSVADNSVIGAYAVVTKCFDDINIAIAGNPAKVIKEGIDWKRERI